ncbi:MAG: helix-hairpin-helix domain-containing protein [Micrococcales bacterium]
MQTLRDLVERHWKPIPSAARRLVLGLAGALVVVLVLLASNDQSANSVSTSDWLGGSASAQPSSAFGQSSNTSVSAKLMVHIVGLVANPGVYELPTGARVMDAVFAAGGFSPGADQSSVNLARPLNDGEQVFVLGKGASAATGKAANALINLNLSDAAGLDSLPGIGPTLAQRIVDYRTANGGFRSVSDLGKVSGIGPALLGKLKNLVTL